MNVRMGRLMRTTPAAVLVLSLASTLHAGVILDLVPTPSPNATLSSEDRWVYQGVSHLHIDVFARLDASAPDHLPVREMQFDFSDSDRWNLGLFPDHADDTGSMSRFVFWDFASTAVCQDDPNRCGYLHDIDGSLYGDDIVSMEYTFSAPHPSIQISLFRDHAVRIGVLEVVWADWLDGEYLLDFLNSNVPQTSAGARMRFEHPSGPIEYSAYHGTISGGRVSIVVPEPATLTMLFVGMIALTRSRLAWTA